MDSTSNILDGAATEAEFAAANHTCQRTISRYRKQPDGLPHFYFGGKVYIPIAEARAWLAARIKRPNPRRKAV